MTKGKVDTKTKTQGSSGNSRRLPEGMTPWKPGQSGNPGGRPKMSREVLEALQSASLPAVQKLVELMNGPDPRVAAVCAQALLDRLYGKPTQQVDAEVRTTNVQQAHLQILLELQAKRDGAMKTIEGDTQRVSVHDPSKPKE